MSFSDVLILGCGFVGQRVAAKLVDRGIRVFATNRVTSPIAGVTMLPLDVNDERSLANFAEKIQPGLTVVHCIPLLQMPQGYTIQHLLFSARLRIGCPHALSTFPAPASTAQAT